LSTFVLAHKLREVLDQPNAPKPDTAQKTFGFPKITVGGNTPWRLHEFLDYFDTMKVRKTGWTLRDSTAPIYGVCAKSRTGRT